MTDVTLPDVQNKGIVDAPESGSLVQQERVAREIQYSMAFAHQYPRSITQVRDEISAVCANFDFASGALYSYPRDGQKITGPTIRFAEEIARAWKHIEFGTRVINRTDKHTEIEAYAWDMQNNIRVKNEFQVRHVRDTKYGQKELAAERDIYEVAASSGSKRLRACILRVIPTYVVNEAVERCKATLTAGASDATSLPERFQRLAKEFQRIGVKVRVLERRLGHSLDDAHYQEFVELTLILNSINNGDTEIESWFGPSIDRESPEAKERIDKLKKVARDAKAARQTSAPAPQQPAPETSPYDEEF